VSNDKSRKSKRIFPFLRIAVVLGGIIWAATWLCAEDRWSRLGQIFLQMNVWVFAVTVGVFFVVHIVVAFRWRLLLKTQSIFIGFRPAVKLVLLGWFYNNFMPGSVGGDLIRAWYVTKHTDKRFEAVLSVFVDRAMGLLCTLMIAVFCYIVFLRGHGNVITYSGGSFLSSAARYGPMFLWMIAVMAALLGFLMLYGPFRRILAKVWTYLWTHGVRMLKKFKDAIVIYCSRPATILAVFALTVLLQIMVITAFGFLGVSMGIEAGIKYYYTFFALVWVVGVVPVSIGGAVVMEGMLAYLFIRFAGVEPEAALALALCQRMVWMITSLPGAVIHLTGAHLPTAPTKNFFIDYKKSIN
jgi:uncharacterized protein (TIRG00374 family)